MAGSTLAPVSNGAVQVLLTEYLVDGLFQMPEIINAKDSDYWNMRETMFNGIWLKSVTFQSTNNYTVSIQSPTKDFYVCGDNIVAVVPRDDTSIALALDRNSAWKYSIPVNVYAGSYLIQGALLTKGPNTMAFDWNTFFMRDVEITSVLPNAQWAGLKAPYVFICGKHKHFILALA